MSVTIEAIAGTTKLQVTGDIDAILAVPFDDDDRFLVGLSDGTLLQGRYDDQLRCDWRVLNDGAGIARIIGSEVTVEWCEEWIAVSCFYDQVNQRRQPEPLPLFPDFDRHAA